MSEVHVQFLSFDGCPLADAARASLEDALAQCEIGGYEAIDILDPGTSEELRGWGSPTILINGFDVGGQPRGHGASCRVYVGANKVPDVPSIVSSIKNATAAVPA